MVAGDGHRFDNDDRSASVASGKSPCYQAPGFHGAFLTKRPLACFPKHFKPLTGTYPVAGRDPNASIYAFPWADLISG